MHLNIEKLKELIKPVLDLNEIFLVDISFKGSGKNQILNIYADTKEGITLKQITETIGLTKEIGEALVSYVTDGRPPSTDRRVFLRSIPPYHGLRSCTVTGIAKTALKRAGITGVPLGSHTLRHTAATLMVRQGAPFKEAADVLGHSLLETTMIYSHPTPEL